MQLCIVASVLLYTPTLLAQTITLSLSTPSATEVKVFGSFDHWTEGKPLNKESKDKWVISLSLERGRYEYKYMVDGKWMINSASPIVDDGFGSKNNIITVRK